MSNLPFFFLSSYWTYHFLFFRVSLGQNLMLNSKTPPPLQTLSQNLNLSAGTTLKDELSRAEWFVILLVWCKFSFCSASLPQFDGVSYLRAYCLANVGQKLSAVHPELRCQIWFISWQAYRVTEMLCCSVSVNGNYFH